MLIHLHKQATTTPKVRATIQASDEPASVLAERYGTTEQTVYKWRHRDSVYDRSHTPHRLQTTLTPAQEAVAVALRRTLLVSIDDLLAVVREFLNPNVSRSGLDRCLRRHGVGSLRELEAKSPRPKHKAFKAYEPGYLHVDVKYLPQMADETSRRYLFVAIDRATRWVFVRVYRSKTAANARRFLRDLERACPMRIQTVLTDNGKEFTDRLFGLRKRSPTGQHEFDRLCADLGIEHRLAPPQHPQTNGMVERFNGRIEEVLQSHHFHSGDELETTLHRYVLLYNQQLPQSALGSKTPLQAMKDWHTLKPELFQKTPYQLPGCDTYPLGYFHIDIAEVRTEQGKLYLFVAIDRTSKLAFVELHERATTRVSADFLRRLIAAVPYKVHTVLTDNGTQFTTPGAGGSAVPLIREAIAAGENFRAHSFELACARAGIDHRTTKPRHPWTNGQVERMNRTLKEATVHRFHYESHDQLRRHLDDFVQAYNFARRLKTLKGLTPYEFICKTWASEPHRFTANPLHQMPGLNI